MEASEKAYWRTASDFLYMCINHLADPILSLEGNEELFILSDAQKQSLQRLSDFLASDNTDYPTGCKLVFDALKLLFFQPYQPKWARNKFGCPLLAFFAVCFLMKVVEKGSTWRFGSFQDGSARWAKIQSSMRLTTVYLYFQLLQTPGRHHQNIVFINYMVNCLLPVRRKHSHCSQRSKSASNHLDRVSL